MPRITLEELRELENELWNKYDGEYLSRQRKKASKRIARLMDETFCFDDTEVDQKDQEE